jgi:hypothetical protein
MLLGVVELLEGIIFSSFFLQHSCNNFFFKYGEGALTKHLYAIIRHMPCYSCKAFFVYVGILKANKTIATLAILLVGRFGKPIGSIGGGVRAQGL